MTFQAMRFQQRFNVFDKESFPIDVTAWLLRGCTGQQRQHDHGCQRKRVRCRRRVLVNSHGPVVLLWIAGRLGSRWRASMILLHSRTPGREDDRNDIRSPKPTDCRAACRLSLLAAGRKQAIDFPWNTYVGRNKLCAVPAFPGNLWSRKLPEQRR